MIAIIFLYLICATTFTLSKAALLYSAPFFYIAVRMLVAGFFLLSFALITRKKSNNKITMRTVLLFVQIILFHMSIPYIAEIWALTRISSTESALLYNLSPFIAAIFSYLWFKETITKTQMLGLCIGISSTIPLIWRNYSCAGELLLRGNVGALCAVLVAVISSAYAWILVKDLVQKGYQISLINGIAMFGSGCIAFIVSLYSGEWSHAVPPVTSWVPFIVLTIAIIIVANIIFYNWYGILLKKYSATLLSFAGILTPIFTGIFGAFFLNECFVWTNVIAIILIAIGLALFLNKSHVEY